MLSRFSLLTVLILSACIGIDNVDDRVPFIVNLTLENNSDSSLGRSVDNPIELGLSTSRKLFRINNLQNQDVTDRIMWKVEPPDVAQIADDGSINGLKEGLAKLTIWENSTTRLAENHTWYVKVVKFERLELKSASNTNSVEVNNTLQLSAQYFNSNNSVEETPITWESQNTNLATVNDAGLLKAVATGQVVIQAKAKGLSSKISINITINQNTNEVASIAITGASPNQTLKVGGTLQLNTIAKNILGNTISPAAGSLTWKSNKTNILTIDNNGLARGVAAGTTEVTVSSGKVESSPITIEVVQFQRIEISSPSNIKSVLIGKTLQLSAQYFNADNMVENVSITWESKNTNLATINSSGLVTGVAAGQATIEASANGVSSQIRINTIADANAVASLEITGASANQKLKVTGTLQLNVVAKNVSGNTISVAPGSLTWKSNKTDILTVNNSGLASGVALGTAEISVSVGGLNSNPVTIEVVQFERVEISTAANAKSALVGNTLQLSARYFNADNTLENVPITWESRSPKIATINSSGLLTGVAAGQVTIRAKARAVSDSISLNIFVNLKLVTSLKITTASQNLNKGRTLQLRVEARNVTGDVITPTNLAWKSSNTSIITINSAGLATGVAEGQANITVSQDGVESSSVKITVIATKAERKGSFVSGRGSTRGTVTLFKDPSDNKLKVRLNSDFNGAGIPGPTIYLSNSPSQVTNALEVQAIQAGAGNNRVLEIPGNPDIGDYEYLIYHCKPFNIIYGVFQFN